MTQSITQTNFDQARFNMVEQQVRPWEVIDPRVLEVMLTLPRENFVPADYQGLAYADIAIPLDNGHSMLKPTLVGRVLQALDIKPTDSILEIGTGSGYLTACLAKLGKQVTSMEIDTDTAARAADTLGGLGLHNINVVVGDALHKIPDNAPFDVIAVTASLPQCENLLPRNLRDGGRLFLVTGEPPVMTAQLITRIHDDHFRSEAIFETELGPLDNLPQKTAFNF